MGRVRAGELVDPDSEDLDLADLAQVVLDQGDRERVTSARDDREAQAKVQAALAEARERRAAGVTRHQESEPRARRARAPVRWRWKPA